MSDRAGEGSTLNNIGQVYGDLKQYPKALELYQQALAIRREVGDLSGEASTLNNMGAAYLFSGNPVAAEAPLSAAIQIYESLRPGLTDTNKVSIFETQKHSYVFLQDSLVAQGKVEQALEVAERGRARAFVELLARRLAAGQASDRQKSFSKQPAVIGHSSLVTGDSSLVTGHWSSGNPFLAVHHKPQKTNDKGQMTNDTGQTVKPITIADIKQIARDQNATLVEYSVIGNEALYIWIVKPTGKVVFQQVDLTKQPLTLPTLVQTVRCFDDDYCQEYVLARNTRSEQTRSFEEVVSPVATRLPDQPSPKLVKSPYL